MLSFFTLENRKRNTKLVCSKIYEEIKDIPYIFTYFVIGHVIFSIVFGFGIIFAKVDSLFFFLSLMVLYVQILTNLYFNGCFLTKIERQIIGKSWYGFPYTQIYKHPTTFKVNTTMWFNIILMLLISSLKIYYFYTSP